MSDTNLVANCTGSLTPDTKFGERTDNPYFIFGCTTAPYNGMKPEFERSWKEHLIMKISGFVRNISALNRGREYIACLRPYGWGMPNTFGEKTISVLLFTLFWGNCIAHDWLADPISLPSELPVGHHPQRTALVLQVHLGRRSRTLCTRVGLSIGMVRVSFPPTCSLMPRPVRCALNHRSAEGSRSQKQNHGRRHQLCGFRPSCASPLCNLSHPKILNYCWKQICYRGPAVFESLSRVGVRDFNGR